MDLNRQNSFSDLLDDIKKEFQSIIADKSHESKRGRQQKLVNVESTEDLEARLIGPKDGKSKTRNAAAHTDSTFIHLSTETSKGHFVAKNELDDDIAKMKSDLNKSYELFQSIKDKLETINFSTLKTRIRDLHVNKLNNAQGNATAEELENIFKQKVLEQRLGELTKEAGVNFRKHPGEFGNIPEVSQFFQACTQLEHGIEDINRQRRKSKKLESRMLHAAESSLGRIDKIRKTLSNSKEPAEEDTLLQNPTGSHEDHL